MQAEQQAILNFIRHYDGQYPPTIEEISNGVGICNNTTVSYHLSELEKLGYTKLRAYKSRSIELS